MRRQARLNWQIRYAGRELTTTQLHQFSDLFGDDAIGVYDDGWRDPRQGALTGVTLISDGSSHSETTWTTRQAAAELAMIHVQTGLRLFHPRTTSLALAKQYAAWS